MTDTTTIQLPDGYNGHTVTCFAKPIMEGKSIVWLQVAEPGKQYMRRWCHRETYERALQAATQAQKEIAEAYRLSAWRVK